MSVATFSSYVDLPFAVTAIGVHLVFTFTLPTTPNSLDLPNPWYINSNEMTILRDRLNPNIVYMGDSQGVIAVNYTLSTSPSPAGGFVSWITLVIALIPSPTPVTNTNNVFEAYNSSVQTVFAGASQDIHFNQVTSTSTDVTKNALGVFTVNTTGDYQIDAQQFFIPAAGLYIGLATPATVGPSVRFGFTTNTTGDATSQGQIHINWPFTAGDTFSIRMFNPGVGAAPFYVAEPQINWISVKRVPTLLT